MENGPRANFPLRRGNQSCGAGAPGSSYRISLKVVVSPLLWLNHLLANGIAHQVAERL
jgi:hypothetical protein